MELEQPVLSAPIQFLVDPIFLEDLRTLPWHVPIAEWHLHGVRILEIKRGLARHEVIFVKTPRFSFGIKQIGEEVSRREVSNYEMLLLNGIHTLVPVGTVTREEALIESATAIGRHYERNITAHTVTLLVEKVVPDSQLFQRKFSFDSRKAIWDAVAELFVELHSNGIYWGDASLSNTLVKFEKVDIPFVGRKTVLKAYLADAETVEIHPRLSDAQREAEIEFFFESMDWMNENLRLSGAERDALATEQDKQYFRARYEVLYGAEEKKKDFFRRTGFNMDEVLGRVTRPEYVDLFLSHLDEHKWYMNERAGDGRTVSIQEATQDWFETIYTPLCRMLRAEGILEYFPGKTAAELYIEIMTNKYYLSRRAGADVGMLQAMTDYAERFGASEQTQPFRKRLAESMKSLLGFAPSRAGR
jgi:hypothetical protein